MIPKSEILDLATQTNLQPNILEKDYVLGWLLAGINQSPAVGEAWVFKGGTCLKKCYFETYRFSEDLDFTLRDPAHINEEFLRSAFNDIAAWVYDRSGIEIPIDRLPFEIYKNPRGVDACRGRVFYRGPVTPASKSAWPRIKLDLTADEIIAETPVIRPVRHDYSDCLPEGFSILSYSYVEVFVEKIRALKERSRPRDLYDVINLFRRPESRDIADQVRVALERKCDHKSIGFPRLSDLESQKEACASGWEQQLAHQLQTLPPFDSFWDELAAFFLWLEHPEQIAAAAPLRAIPAAAAAGSVVTLRPGMPQFSKLDRIRFAAVNRLCVEMAYRKENGERKSYLIEPYSLRITADNNVILYAVKLPSAEIRSFRTDRIIDATVTEQTFAPRYSIDFIPAGPAGASSRPAAMPISTAPRKTTGGGPRYVFRCAVCDKQFTRSTYDATLKAHKDKQGTPCYGRYGIYITTNY